MEEEEVKLQVLCSFVGATAMSEKGAKQLLKAASKIRLFQRSASEKKLPSVSDVEKLFGG